MGEFDRLERWRSSRSAPPGETWAGDDAAVVLVEAGTLLLAADVVVEGVHVDRRWSSDEDMGWKAVATNLSDIAAMGGIPVQLLVSMVVGPGFDADACNAGIEACAGAHGGAVVGGDLSSGPASMVAVTVTGRMAEGVAPVLRSGGRPGDAVAVTGPLGLAAAELSLLRSGLAVGEIDGAAMAHRRPVPRLAQGAAAASAGASAMIDVSDGFVADLGHIADESGVGFDLEGVPACQGVTTEQALTGGDDYELVICHRDPGVLATAFEAAGLEPPIVVGRLTERLDRLVSGRSVVGLSGWEHPL